jgi:xylulose-5-phosphate/fructose-6-phosphate phosphoketolase
MSSREFDTLFTTDKPVIFAYHGYPTLIHRLTYRRTNHANIHVRGFKEEGTTTTPFDMVVRNRVSRYHLVMDAINNARRTPPGASDLKAWCEQRLAEHAEHVVAYLEDMPDVRDWVLDSATTAITP